MQKANRFQQEVSEKTKHKKKAEPTGQPRSKHKHLYETVLLKSYYTVPDFKTGKPVEGYTEFPTKVCVICGRVDYIDQNPEFYEEKTTYPFRFYTKELSAKARALPKYHMKRFEKFAQKEDDLTNDE